MESSQTNNEELEQGGFDFILPQADEEMRAALEAALKETKDQLAAEPDREFYCKTKIMLIEELLEKGTVNSWNFSRAIGEKAETNHRQFLVACHEVHLITDPGMASKVIMLPHTEFMLMVADRMAAKLGHRLEHDDVLQTVHHLAMLKRLEFDPATAIDIVERVAPGFKCDLTISLSTDDPDLLADQLAALFIRFGRAHARACPDCFDDDAASVVLVRFLNTYHEIVRYGEIPADFPHRERYFLILDGSVDYTKADLKDHRLSGEKLRQAVKNWNITGN